MSVCPVTSESNWLCLLSCKRTLAEQRHGRCATRTGFSIAPPRARCMRGARGPSTQSHDIRALELEVCDDTALHRTCTRSLRSSYCSTESLTGLWGLQFCMHLFLHAQGRGPGVEKMGTHPKTMYSEPVIHPPTTTPTIFRHAIHPPTTAPEILLDTHACTHFGLGFRT